MRKCSKRRKGAVVVEFALVLPLFLLVVFAVIEFSRAFFVQNMLTNASREAVRYAVSHNADGRRWKTSR